MDKIGIRLWGGLGDTIVSSCLFYNIYTKHEEAEWIVLISVPYTVKDMKAVEKNIKELLNEHPVSQVVSFPIKKYRTLFKLEWSVLKELGVSIIYDCLVQRPSVWSVEKFETIPQEFTFREKPDITIPSFELPLPYDNKLLYEEKLIAIYRYSGRFKHFEGRNLDNDKWKEITDYILNKGYKVILLGKKDEDKYDTDERIIDLRDLPLLYSLGVIKFCNCFVAPMSGLANWSRFWIKTFTFGTSSMWLHHFTGYWFAGELYKSKKNIEWISVEQNPVHDFKVFFDRFDEGENG